MQLESHSRQVERLFDDKASIWSQKYTDAGRMAERLARFGDALARSMPAAGASVLDFGCGAGDLGAHLAGRGFAVTGVDISRRMIHEATTRFPSAVAWQELPTEWTSLPFEDGSFQVITVSSVLEYVARLDIVFREFARVCRPQGILLATVPSDSRRVEQLVKAAHLPAHLRPLLPKSVCRYLDYLDLSRNRLPLEVWIALAALAGFVHEVEASDLTGALVLLAFRRL